MNLHEHEKFLWGLCYRMTGSAADADDLVQDTFTRALEKPPRDTAAPLRPWLTRVAMNLARDALRRRRRAPYAGPWLPEPIDTDADEAPVAVEPPSTEGRYDLLESVSFAFLLALEALTPKQRAVLLLRDVFDYSVRDTAEAVGASADNVKQIHLRARRAMGGYDTSRVVPTREMQARNKAALDGFIEALLTNDLQKIESVLVPEATALTDGGGRYHAARRPIYGASRVARFILGVTAKGGAPTGFELRTLNGFPALVATYAHGEKSKLAPLVVLRLDTTPDGRVRTVYSVSAPQKLRGLSARRLS